MLSQYKCNMDGHQEQQIIGICVNTNCKLQRKVCLDCIVIHQNKDDSFTISDIKNDKVLQKLLNEFKENNKWKISNTYMQCYIQQYFLSLLMIEYSHNTQVQYQALENIINDLDKFEKETWNQISLTDYIQHNIGTQTYFRQILQKLERIELSKDEHLSRVNEIFMGQNIQQIDNSDSSNSDEVILSMQKNKDDLLQQIMKYDVSKKEFLNESPSELILNFIQSQDQILKSNILKEQFDKIKNLITKDGKQFLQKIKDATQKAIYNKERSIQLCEEGIKLMNGKKYKEAIELFDQSIQLDPQNSKAYFKKGRAFSNLQRYQDAIEIFDQAIKLHDKYVEAYNQKGKQLHNLQRYQEAVVQYEQAIQINPKYFNAYLNKGVSLNEIKKYSEAIEMFDQAIKLDAKSVSTYFNKGKSFQNLERNHEAIVLYDEVIKLDPKFVQAYLNKGIILNNLKRYQDAIVVFDQVIKLDVNNSLLYYNKGNSLYNLQRLQEALEIYNEAIKLNPKDIQAHLQRANSLNQLKRYQEAILEYDKVIKLDKKSAVSYYNKGVCYQYLQKYKESITMYEQAIQLDPYYNSTLKGISQLLVVRSEDSEFIRNCVIVLLCGLLLLVIFRKI